MESNLNNQKGNLIPILLGTSLVLNILLTSVHLYATYKQRKAISKTCGCKKKV